MSVMKEGWRTLEKKISGRVDEPSVCAAEKMG